MKGSSIVRSLAVALAAAAFAVGCATDPVPFPGPLVPPKADQIPAVTLPTGTTPQTTLSETPRPPEASRLSSAKPQPPAPPGPPEEANITLMFDQLPLPTFIQMVYGNILKKNFSVDPQVSARNDLVTVRAAKPQTASQIENTARLLLKSYGVAVMDIGGGVYRIVPDSTQSGYQPEIRRGRALPDTPMPLRQVFQLVELNAVRNSDVSLWIKTMFGQRVQVLDDPTRNAVLLSGQSDDVTAALEVLHVLDQPLMKGRGSARINPAFWSADELAKKLTDVLTAEGYYAATSVASNFPLTILPIQEINAIIVFSADPAIIAHVASWAKELDKPANNRPTGAAYFTYQARYTSAQDLAKTMSELMSGAPVTTPAVGTAGAAPGAVVASALAASRRSNRVVVDVASNTLIFQTGADDYLQLQSLLQEIDKPAKAALIEVTVVEVTLDGSLQLGVEWAFEHSNAKGTLLGGTLGGLAIGTTGLVIKGLNTVGDLRLMIQALATSNRANILSSPRVLARNGETATIQVGSQVPIVTQQQTSPTTGGTGSILQSVQYKDTGVILKVKPIIHGSERVELEITQEVSDTTTAGVAGSPVIDTRKVDTKLSLRDGATVVLGGLISQVNSRTVSGIPWLKDIPVLGQLFRTNTDTSKKTELIVLITPYVVNDDHDAQAITDAFRRQLNSWAQLPTIVDPTTLPLLPMPAPSIPGPVPTGPANGNQDAPRAPGTAQ